MEIANHTKHLTFTFDRLLHLLFTESELDLLCTSKESLSVISERSSWIKFSDLVVKGVTTQQMVLMHLLWFQKIGRVVIEDIDPLSNAVRLHISLDNLLDREVIQAIS